MTSSGTAGQSSSFGTPTLASAGGGGSVGSTVPPGPADNGTGSGTYDLSFPGNMQASRIPAFTKSNEFGVVKSPGAGGDQVLLLYTN
jgi:hypothetical protein